MRSVSAAIVLACVLTACGGSSHAPGPTASPTFNRGTVLVDTDQDTVLLHALFAQTEDERSEGLTHPPALPGDEAIVFVFFHAAAGPVPRTSPPQPLSVAYFDVDGKILNIVDVAACRQDAPPCAVPSPGVSYMGALVTRAGVLERLGVEPGDVVHPVPGGE